MSTVTQATETNSQFSVHEELGIRPTTINQSSADGDFVRYWSRNSDRASALAAVGKRTEEAIKKTGIGLQLSCENFNGHDLSGFPLRRCILNRAQLHGAKLDGADLSEANLICPGLERASFRGAKLDFAYMHAIAAQVCSFDDASLRNLIDATGSLFHGCSMRRTRFDNAVLSGVLFYQCDASQAVFDGAELQGSTINECYLPRSSFHFANLSQVTMTKAHLTGSSLLQSRGECLSILRPTSVDGLVLENAYLPYFRLSKASGRILAKALAAPFSDFSLSNLAKAELEEADLSEARLLSVNLASANLVGAVLNGVSVRSCQLDGADLSRASGETISITESTMRYARLGGFRARCAFIRDCDLDDADFSQAYLYRSMITGDPPQSMALNRANFEGANLVQSYIAAGMTGSNLEAARTAYVRMNQSSLRKANLSGVTPFQASFVKTDFSDAEITTFEPPFFADRCPGLQAALEGVEDQKYKPSEYLADFSSLMRRGREGSS
ncbi:pentapeptide repeat-containing protein [Bradyrhizobium sp. 183]|uniref:pentapeptide repeat-containing protein n=1 Tax=unclassified Bradyrhizobium TaxID=2631580 RepID=UPI001FFE3B1B|nr:MULTISPECIES: pentapeptide repeat-containing protein [unclassified Bradyrhizobium]UPJ79416.1 pentapeptide repeat-containing protein [Bradyrhizobium sp. 184]UPJ87212.1 pentapeptide repeat-containing protein [Bradyrhizobium sp. 183]